jgi:TonB family protein
MTKILLLGVLLGLSTGCATNETQYQIGIAGSITSKSEAERAYVEELPQARSTGTFDSPPRALSSHFPDYPSHLRRADISGRVLVQFTVEPDGSVSEPAVRGSPPAELAALALDAVVKWKFSPAMKNGAPVRARISQPFLFKLE